MMEIRPATLKDLESLADIDGTVESSRYLHLDRGGEGLEISWNLQERALRTKLIEPNPLDDDRRFILKQIAGGVDDGVAWVAEHEGGIVASLLAKPDHLAGTMYMMDLRVDYDLRRQGVGSAMTFQLIGVAREQGLRAVSVEVKTNNQPANQFFSKCGFELAGVDARRYSNHDMVKESATLFWYAALD